MGTHISSRSERIALYFFVFVNYEVRKDINTRTDIMFYMGSFTFPTWSAGLLRGDKQADFVEWPSICIH